MPVVTFLPHEKLCPQGLVVEAPSGTSILELAHDHHIEMESACAVSYTHLTLPTTPYV